MSLRVIAGAYRGRHLRAPRGQSTRPTSARVREALFSILGALEGVRVLDLYAGSGALGIEALSRGASVAVFVENERAAQSCIRDNLAAVGAAERARVLPLRASAAVSALPAEPFDLVLCDPPWEALGDARAVLEKLASTGSLAPAARVALEHSARDAEPDVPGLVAYDRRRWGDTAVSLFRAG
ncbi:MAG TPA: 16S rRNA (guanine(966)-N(2))-methyltransferase RsmD [Polyangiaceae bacterium]